MNVGFTNFHILASGLRFPEGPAFAPDGSLWAVELKGASLVRIQDEELQRFAVGGSPNGIAIDPAGKIWFCDAELNAIRCFDPNTQQCETLVSAVERQPLNKPNDLAFDAVGNLIFTCPGDSRQEPSGYVCVRRRDGQVKKIAEGLYFPNGLAFNADGTELIIAETYQHRLWKGQWNAQTCTWEPAQPWCSIGGPNGPGGPDGMAFDQDQLLYVAVYGTGSIRVVNPAGEVVEQILLPAQNPTNCAFDPSGRWGLVITEAEQGLILSYPSAPVGQRLLNTLTQKNIQS
jgi:gluconolactonase